MFTSTVTYFAVLNYALACAPWALKTKNSFRPFFPQAPSNLHKAWFAGCFMKSANSEAASIFFDIVWRTRAPITFLLLKPSLKKLILKPANLGLSARCMHAYSHWGHLFINFPPSKCKPITGRGWGQPSCRSPSMTVWFTTVTEEVEGGGFLTPSPLPCLCFGSAVV